jgi:hypothetical protein
VDNDHRVLQAPDGAFFSSLPPRYAAMLRGLLWAILIAVIEAVAVFLSGLDVSELPAWLGAVIPILVYAFRQLEGEIDQRSTG